MKKTLFLVMIGLLLTGAAFAQGVPFTGSVYVLADSGEGGKSTIEMEEGTRDGMPSWRIYGRMMPGLQYPWVNLNFEPDDATKERLRNARTIRFKVLGDGNRFRMEYCTTAVRDYGYHAYNFNTTKGQVTQVTIQTRQFIQPGWASAVRLNPQRIEKLAIIPDDALRGGEPPFDITVWDLRIE